jgi:hypothetical protein
MTSSSKREALTRDLGALRDALAEAALRLERAPDDPEAQAAVASLQQELVGATRRLELYDLAQQAEQREAEHRQKEDNRAHVAELITRIEALHKASTKRAVALVSAIEALGPIWSELLVELGEARALVASAVRAAGGGEALRRLLTVPLDGHDALAGTVGGTLASTGLGVIGPSLAPWIVTTPPSGVFRRVDIAQALDTLHAQRLDVIERAASFSRFKEVA